MPPRYAYWTILIDGKATAFRARDRDELLPTFHQLARKNPDIAMRYFSRGRLWDSPEQAQWASRNVKRPVEKRGPDWRPGGRHEDPRARFAKRPPRDTKRGWDAKRPPRPATRDDQNTSRPPGGEKRGWEAKRPPRPATRDNQNTSRPPGGEKRGWEAKRPPQDPRQRRWNPTRPPRKKR